MCHVKNSAQKLKMEIFSFGFYIRSLLSTKEKLIKRNFTLYKQHNGKEISEITFNRKIIATCNIKLDDALKKLECDDNFLKLSQCDREIFEMYFCENQTSTYVSQTSPIKINSKNLVEYLRKQCFSVEI